MVLVAAMTNTAKADTQAYSHAGCFRRVRAKVFMLLALAFELSGPTGWRQ